MRIQWPTWLAAVVVASLAGRFAAGADLPLIRLSEAQQRSANLSTEAVRRPGADDLAVIKGGGMQLNGQVTVPNRSVEVVMSTMSGQLAEVLVEVGQKVMSGQALGRMYSADFLTLQRDYLQAVGASEVAANRAERDDLLLSDGIISASRAQESHAARQAAAATLQQQRQMLRLAGMATGAISALKSAEAISPYLLLHARTGGVVLEQPLAAGQHVDAGQPVFKLAAGTTLWLDLQATRDQAAEIRIGDRVSVADCDGQARVISIGAQLHAGSQTVAVRAQLPDAMGCVRPNEYVQVYVSPADPMPDALSVPTSGLTRYAGQTYVFERQADGFRPVAVQVLRQLGDHTWVRGALNAGSQVASRGVAALKGTWQGLGAAAVESGEKP